jgi:hypothetical protein
MNNIKVMTIFIVVQIFLNKNDYVFSRSLIIKKSINRRGAQALRRVSQKPISCPLSRLSGIL